MIAGTYGSMQQQIADELGDRPDLLEPMSDLTTALSPIQQAIQSAISTWEREKFYFNEYLIDTPNIVPTGGYVLMTAQGQEYYGADILPASMYSGSAAVTVSWPGFPSLVKIDRLWVLVSSNRYMMYRRTPAYMQTVNFNPSITGQPIEYTYTNEMLRFYPIPDNSYPMGMDAVQRLPTLVKVTDLNSWTEDAYDLIRCQAKLLLYRDLLKRPDQADVQTKAIWGDASNRYDHGFAGELRRETRKRKSGGGGGIRPTHF